MFNSLKPQSLFITATDTGVGKTYVTAKLGQYFQSLGYSVAALKPISSGGREDAEILKAELHLDEPLDILNPVNFELPLAPYAVSLAIGQPGITKEDALSKIMSAYDQLQKRYDIVLVEGIGGVRVPLWEHYEVTDLIHAFQLPAVIVARAGLGTINHTLLTIDALRQKEIEIAAIVLNGVTGKDLSEETNRTAIETFSGIPKDRFIQILPSPHSPPLELTINN
jgi:dethiobiotin synthetase